MKLRMTEYAELVTLRLDRLAAPHLLLDLQLLLGHDEVVPARDLVSPHTNLALEELDSLLHTADPVGRLFLKEVEVGLGLSGLELLELLKLPLPVGGVHFLLSDGDCDGLLDELSVGRRSHDGLERGIEGKGEGVRVTRREDKEEERCSPQAG